MSSLLKFCQKQKCTEGPMSRLTASLTPTLYMQVQYYFPRPTPPCPDGRPPCGPRVQVMPCTGHLLVFLLSCDIHSFKENSAFKKSKFLSYIFIAQSYINTWQYFKRKVYLTEHLTLTVTYLLVTSITLFLHVHSIGHN